MKRGTISRNKKEDELVKGILYLLSISENFLSTHDISRELEKPWHSVQTRCLRLQLQGEINGFRVGRINLWQTKGGAEKEVEKKAQKDE